MDNISLKHYIPLVILFAIVTIAAVYRIEHMHKTEIVSPIRADAMQYTHYAFNLLQYGTLNMKYDPAKEPHPDNWRTPGYPFFLAAIIKFGGIENFYYSIRLLQSLLGVLTVLLTYLVARFIMPNWAGLLAAFLAAISPHLISLENYILTEALFSFFLLLSTYLYLCAHKGGKLLFFGLSGATFGYAYLINPTVFFIPWIFVLITLLEKEKRKKKYVIALALFCLVFSVFWGSYAVRNRVNVLPEHRQGRLMAAFCSGIYPDFIFKTERFKYFMYHEDPEFPTCTKSFENFANIFWKRLKEEPAKYLKWYIIGKPQAFWGWNIYQGSGDVYIYRPLTTLFNKSPLARSLHALMKKIHPFILLMGLAGIILALVMPIWNRENRGECAYIYMIFSVLVYYSLMFIVFFSLSRYSIPLRPELYIGAAWSLSCCYNLISTRILQAKNSP